MPVADSTGVADLLLKSGATGSEETARGVAHVIGKVPAEALIRVLRDLTAEDEPPREVESPFYLLRDLVDDPELLRPPPVVIPRLVFRGRTTLLSGPEKSGKSTLAGQVAADKSAGRATLGEAIPPGEVVVVAPDEALGDTVRRLHERGADLDRVRLLAVRPPNLLLSLSRLLEENPSDFVLVDSLAEWARITDGRAPESGDAAGWGAIVRPLVQVSRDFDVGILLLHHAKKGGGYRDSNEIGASVDAILEMTLPGKDEDSTLRRITGAARWQVEPFSVRLDGGRYVLGSGGPVSLEARIVIDTGENPGTSRTAQRERLAVRAATHGAAVNRLLEIGGIVERSGRLFVEKDVEGDLL